MKRISVQKIALMGVLSALAIALGIADHFIPLPWIPGAKIGLANIVVIIALYEFGLPEASSIALLKVFIVSLVAGNIFQMGFFMSLAGSASSLLTMFLLKRFVKPLTVYGVSPIGSIIHSFAQMLVYSLFLGNASVFYYFPLLSLFSVLAGLFIAFIADRVMAIGIIEKQKRKYGYR